MQVITRLIVGGAQETAVLTCALADPERYEMVLVTGPETGPEGSLHEEARARGVRVVVLDDLRREVSPWRDRKACRSLRALIEREQPDVVHTHSSKAGILGRLAARRAGVPVVVHTVHGWSFHDHMSRPLRQLYIALERWCAPKADKLVLVTEVDRDKGLSEGIGSPEQYVIVRSGIELDAFRHGSRLRMAVRSEIGIDTDAPVLGSVMRLSPQKDPLAFVTIADRVLAALPNAHVVLVGDGPLRAEVEAAVAVTDHAHRWHLLGLRRDVADLLSAMDAFLLTSSWEGLPRTVVQAMAADVPVVATRADGVADVIEHGRTGLLFDQGDVSAGVDLVIEILTDRERATAIRTRAAAKVEEYGAEAMVERLCALYDSLLSSSGTATETARPR